MTHHEISGLISVGFALAAAVPYIITALRGQNKPHVFSWLIWTIVSTIVFLGQLASGAGAGAWATGFTALLNLIIVAVGLRFGEKNITRSDWMLFLGALACIPLWLATNNPLHSVVLATIIDLVGYGPTLRKAWMKPHEENMTCHAVTVVKHVFALLALQAHNFTSIVFPAIMFVANGLVVVFLLVRRGAVHRGAVHRAQQARKQ